MNRRAVTNTDDRMTNGELLDSLASMWAALCLGEFPIVADMRRDWPGLARKLDIAVARDQWNRERIQDGDGTHEHPAPGGSRAHTPDCGMTPKK